ncbi:RNA polymerase sigma factor [Telmatospirillum sp. J64-1]|uniref:RNA polymerase sigma factor n=1 Tax=Telmatospirillum sp. J64-1 TaxID=2502183 RepID=UPI00115DAAD7|nr:RNA polymerase sigma factor [Telmatospirillum sp. J64-1]
MPLFFRDDADDRLLARIAEGDEAAFRTLMDRHLDRAFGLAQRILGSRSDAEDVVQDAFLKVWDRAESWRPGEAKFSTWLWRVVTNRCLDLHRRPRHEALEAVPEPQDPAEDVVSSIAAGQEERRLKAAMADLPERQRAALALIYETGLSNAQAAEVLGISVGALEQLLVRAKRSLRGRLQEETE